MDISHLKNVCLALDGALSQATDALNEIEKHTVTGVYQNDDGTVSDEDDKRLEYHLHRCCVMMAVALDGLGLVASRRQLLRDWERHVSSGLRKTEFIPEFDVVVSDPLSYLHHTLDGVKAFAHTEETTLRDYQTNKLIEVLRDTAVLVHRRNLEPRNEYDVQHVMHDYLGVLFTEFSTNVTISGTIKSFKPDSGVRNLGIAIEFKYANNKDEVTKALSGVYEDIAGYSGSRDWTRFITVVYMTGPYESESKFKADLLRAEAHAWTPIFVNGAGDRKKRIAAGSK